MDQGKYNPHENDIREAVASEAMKAAGMDPSHPPKPQPTSVNLPLTPAMIRTLRGDLEGKEKRLRVVAAILALIVVVASIVAVVASQVDVGGGIILALGSAAFVVLVCGLIGLVHFGILQRKLRRGTYILDEGRILTDVRESKYGISYILNVGGRNFYGVSKEIHDAAHAIAYGTVAYLSADEIFEIRNRTGKVIYRHKRYVPAEAA